MGPVVAASHEWIDVAELLFDAGFAALGGRFEQFEIAVDARNIAAIELAQRRGHRRDTGSVLLELDRLDDHTSGPPTSATIEFIADVDTPSVAALHDQLFPNTHLTGKQVVAHNDGLMLVARLDTSVVGYVRAEIQSGGSGYLDFVGVDPNHRNAGIGQALVERSIVELERRGAETVTLTVREDNQAARALYARLGFTGDRILVPLRLGFTI